MLSWPCCVEFYAISRQASTSCLRISPPLRSRFPAAERISSCLRLQTDSPALSVSIGFSVYPADGLSVPQLLEAADKRLYQNKKSRNSSEAKAKSQHAQSTRT